LGTTGSQSSITNEGCGKRLGKLINVAFGVASIARAFATFPDDGPYIVNGHCR